MKTSWVLRVGWLTASLFLLAGPFLGWLTFRVASHLEHERGRLAFETHISERAALLEREADEIAQDLHHIRAFFGAQDEVTRAEFQAFTQDILDSHPAIHALEWVPRVAANQREGHERSARAEGLQGYRIQSRTPQGTVTPAPPQDEYYPVFYVQPFAPNARELGLDLSSESGLKASLAAAANTQKITFTDPVDLVREPGSSKGFIALVSVYRERAARVPGRPAELEGFVVFVLSVREIVAESLLLGGGPPRIQFQLTDNDVEGQSVVIDSSPDWDRNKARSEEIAIRSITLGDQDWQLQGLPTDEFLSAHLTRLPLMLGIGVFLFWEALSGLGVSLSKWTRDVALRKQDRIFKSVLCSQTEGVIVAGTDGRFLLFNDAAQRILGVGLREVSPAQWSSVYGCYLPDTQTPYPPDRLPLARAIQGEEVRDAEIFIRNPGVPSGTWISVSGAPLVDEDGGPAGGVVVLRDISTAKKSAEALRSSLKQLEDMKYALDQAAIVAITDREGTITYVNDKFCEISGYSREELLGRNHRIVNSGYHSREFFEELWKTIADGKVWRNEFRNRSKAGGHFWVDTTIVPFLNEHGKPERYLSIQSDITERRKQQETVERLSNAVEQTADTVFITNRDGVIEYVNPAFEVTTGYSRAEALGNTPRILKSGKYGAGHYQELWGRILSGEVYRITTINRKKNGELYHAEQTITPMKDAEARVTHFVSVLKDVTERIKTQERELEVHYASLVQKKLYPVQPPQLEGFDIAGAVFPAEATCGDYFDYLSMPNGAVGIAIGDVCGHGLGPALIMSETRAYVRSLARVSSELSEILDPVNEWLHSDLEEASFVTLLLTCIDVSARRLVYANAGHTPGYILDRSGALKATLNSTGFPLGMFPHSKYPHSESVDFGPGDLVVLLTDGITESEAPDGRPFEGDRVLEVIRAHQNEPAEHILLHVRRAIYDFTQGMKPSDDLTMVVCKADRLD